MVNNMSLTNEIRDQAKTTATAAQKHLYGNFKSGINLFAIADKYQLINDETYTTFAMTIGDIILGFYDVADTEPLLIQELGISAEVATPLAADVREFLAPLDDPNWQPPVAEDTLEPTFNPEVTSEETEVPASVTESNDTAIVSDTPQVTRPTVPPAVSESTQPAEDTSATKKPDVAWESSADTPSIRTMAHDMEGARSPQRNTFEPLDDDTPTHISNQS